MFGCRSGWVGGAGGQCTPPGASGVPAGVPQLPQVQVQGQQGEGNIWTLTQGPGHSIDLYPSSQPAKKEILDWIMCKTTVTF